MRRTGAPSRSRRRPRSGGSPSLLGLAPEGVGRTEHRYCDPAPIDPPQSSASSAVSSAAARRARRGRSAASPSREVRIAPRTKDPVRAGAVGGGGHRHGATRGNARDSPRRRGGRGAPPRSRLCASARSDACGPRAGSDQRGSPSCRHHHSAAGNPRRRKRRRRPALAPCPTRRETPSRAPLALGEQHRRASQPHPKR